ncbi:hypothetical protein CPB86DRAFT_212969 [Serendipita vermifera]|nr:hypothetical protein CPB86DRAFT_212969 [Serendipita vermifera]
MKFVYIESRLVHIVVRKPPPLLEHIYIVSRINSSVEQDQVALDDDIPSTLEPLTWTTIEYFDRHCHLLWALIPRLTNLISLNILATFETLGGLFIRIHQLPVLQSLTVCAQVPPYLSKSFPAAANVQANRSIQNFGFQPDYSSEDSGFDGDAVARFYESLRQVMAKCPEAVKSMKITWFDVPLCSQILGHDTFPLLTDLDMAVHRIRSSNSLEKIPFSVRKLSFRGSIAD